MPPIIVQTPHGEVTEQEAREIAELAWRADPANTCRYCGIDHSEFPPCACPHNEFSVRHTVGGSPMDDHTTEAGHCYQCGKWFVRTFYVSGEYNERPMTDAESMFIRSLDDQYRRNQ